VPLPGKNPSDAHATESTVESGMDYGKELKQQTAAIRPCFTAREM